MEYGIVALYVWLGYWATGLVLYHNKIVFHRPGCFFMQKVAFGFFFGWLFIPIALIMKLLRIR